MIKALKVKLILLFFLFTCRFSLDAKIIETTIFKNHETGVQIGLYGSMHDGKGKEQVSAIAQILLELEEPLLVLNEDQPCLNNDYYYQSLADLEVNTDVVLHILARFGFKGYFSDSVTYVPIDYRLYAQYALIGLMKYRLLGKIYKQLEVAGDILTAQEKEEAFLKDRLSMFYQCLNKEFFKETPFKFEELENPSLTTLLLISSYEIQRLKKLVIPEEIQKLFSDVITNLEISHSKKERILRESTTEEVLSLRFSQYISNNVNKLTIDQTLSFLDPLTNLQTVELEALYEIYTTSDKKIAVFTGAAHTENLAIWLQELGWSIVHKTERNCKNGVPFSDFDFLK